MSTTIEIPITINRIQCKCPKAEVLTSIHRHHFVSCSCGKTFTDGGHDYFRRGGDYESLSGTYMFLVESMSGNKGEHIISRIRTLIYLKRLQGLEIETDDLYDVEDLEDWFTDVKGKFRIINWYKR